MSENRENEQINRQLPKAKVKRNWKTWLFWLIPIGAAVMAGYFIYRESVKKGPTITIFFQDAAGMEKGKSQLKYRGVTIGTVEKVELTDDHRQARVEVSLEKSGASVAKSGSRFWIVQPRVRLNEIKGLRTVVAGDYIAVDPGGGKEQEVFQGLAEPPPPRKEEMGLRVVLIAEKLGSVKPHSPVMFKGVQVGEVWETHLGPESQVVQILLNIDKHYAPLVRMNSVFWNAGGINFNIGLSGLDISAQSAQALLFGGIDFATPDNPGKEAYPDTAFRLYDKPQDAWLSWSPAIKLQQPPLPAEPPQPKPGE